MRVRPWQWFISGGDIPLFRRKEPASEPPLPRWSPETGSGWREWRYNPPQHSDGLVEMRSVWWETSQIVRREDIHPWANVAGVYWRPWRGETIDVGAKILDLPAA